MRLFAVILCLLCLALASACAHHNENGYEPTVKVRGQYDAAFRVTR